jgi:hypothetical protein
MRSRTQRRTLTPALSQKEREKMRTALSQTENIGAGLSEREEMGAGPHPAPLPEGEGDLAQKTIGPWGRN